MRRLRRIARPGGPIERLRVVTLTTAETIRVEQ